MRTGLACARGSFGSLKASFFTEVCSHDLSFLLSKYYTLYVRFLFFFFDKRVVLNSVSEKVLFLNLKKYKQK